MLIKKSTIAKKLEKKVKSFFLIGFINFLQTGSFKNRLITFPLQSNKHLVIFHYNKMAVCLFHGKCRGVIALFLSEN